MQITINKTPYYAYTANQKWAARDAILFIHGAAMDHSVWSQQSRYFAYHGYNIAAIDLPGHHRSGGKPLPDITATAGWTIQIIKHLTRAGSKNLHLVGHSMGALIALETAAMLADLHQRAPKIPKAAKTKAPLLPPTLKSLSLLGFAYPMQVTPQLLDAAKNDPPAAYAMMTQWSHAARIGGEPTPGFWSPGMQMRMMENSKPGALFADLTACNNYQRGEQALAQLAQSACPILFLCGARDRMAPAKLAATHHTTYTRAEQPPPAKLVLLPDCGHNLMAESPDGVLNELKHFIANA